MLVIKKNGLISVIIVVLLVLGLVSAVKNYGPTSQQQVAEPVTTNSLTADIDINEEIAKADLGSDFFAEYRMERERLRGKQLELLKDIINNNANDEKARAAASMRMVEITADMEKEMKAENLVKSQGFQDCVVILQPQATTIVVQSENLTLAKEKELREIVSKATSISADKMSIIVREPE